MNQDFSINDVGGNLMNRVEFDKLCEDKGIMLADGLDEALIGVCYCFGTEGPLALYDMDKIVEVLQKGEAGMSEDEAQEWLEYNIIGAYMGDKTPVYAVNHWRRFGVVSETT